MNPNDYDDENGWDYLDRESDDDDDEFDLLDEGDKSGDDEADDGEPPPGYTTGESGVEISMEVDEKGNEVWFAEDSRIPGSTSMGHSLEEAVDGVEERRKQYREMLRRSREQREQRQPLEEEPED